MATDPIDLFLKPFGRFLKSEQTAGIFLFVSSVVALVWANSPLSEHYKALWHFDLSISIAGYSISNSLHHWINDGLMSMFFFVVGLELKREIMGGELSSFRHALLPLAAAVGGMVVPALIFILLNPHSPENDGWGIPMATDIAFALSILAVLGKRVPLSLKIFLTALAIADDLGAVLVIAFFYTSDISLISLGTGVIFMLVLMTANILGVRSSVFYSIVGIGGLWLAFLMSGVHATIAGVLAAMTIPARTKIDEISFTTRLKNLVSQFTSIPPNDLSLLEPEQMHVITQIKDLTRKADTPLQRLENGMHPMVVFIVMPIFALANAGIEFSDNFFEIIIQPVSMGVLLGLVAGKFIGIFGGTYLMVRLNIVQLPLTLRWRHIAGAAFLGGVGFTMSLFITNLAYGSSEFTEFAKSGILVGSLLSAILGMVILRASPPS